MPLSFSLFLLLFCFVLEFIHYDEVEIIKPPDFSVKAFFESAEGSNDSAAFLQSDSDSSDSSSYPVGIALSVFLKRNTRERCM